MFWNRPPTRFPVIDGRGVPPVLMVQSDHDPTTAIEGARIAHAGFAKGSHFLTVTNESQHGIYGTSPPYTNTRVDDLVDTFLTEGRLPVETSVPGVAPLPPPGS